MRAWRGRPESYDGRRKSDHGDDEPTKKVRRKGRPGELGAGGRARGGERDTGGGGEDDTGGGGEEGRGESGDSGSV